MNGCIHCQRAIPLEQGGTMILSADSEKQLTNIRDLFSKYNINFQLKRMNILIPYDHIEELQSHTELLKAHFSEKNRKAMRGNIINEKKIPDLVMFPLYSYEEIEERILNPDYVKIIQEQYFTSHMQPIFCTQEETVYGYEFLLRPSKEDFPFYPGELFAFSRRSGLHSMLDSQARINAIRTGSEKLVQDEMLFINFLPSSIYDPAHCLKSTFEAVETFHINPERLVFEVVETEKIHDMSHLKTIFNEYQQAGVKVALDDIGSGYATEKVLQELRPDYAKIDRMIIQNCHLDENKLKTIEEISKVSKDQGTFLLAEGIETKEEYMAVKQLVDYCQGYYFAKPEKDPYVSHPLC